jgi:lysophospholipase L1-like esterase
MKLFTFGDSWTEGVGGNLKEEYATNIPEEKTKIRHKYCWPKKLSESLGNIQFQNDGVGAFSNNAIFNSISFKLKNGLIKSDDFVIVMWSSSLRDAVPFFPSDDTFRFWGQRSKSKEHLFNYLIDSNLDGKSQPRINPQFVRAEKNYRDYYFSNLYTDIYYDIINQNYIMYLQFIFKEMGIRYMFCDAFDTMVKDNIMFNIDKSNLIDSNRYWGFKKKTFKDFLCDLNRKDVWEDNELWHNRLTGKHPNNIGYELIANEIYNYILDNNLLKTIQIDNSVLI